jgi:hypothetical protein
VEETGWIDGCSVGVLWTESKCSDFGAVFTGILSPSLRFPFPLLLDSAYAGDGLEKFGG